MSTSIKDANGEIFAPLADSTIDPNVKVLLEMMKPLLANMIGSLGENFHFLVFPSESKDGELLANPKEEGTLIVSASGKDYSFRLPLASTLPPRYDPDTGEKFPGNYKFSPFSGSELVSDSPS